MRHHDPSIYVPHQKALRAEIDMLRDEKLAAGVDIMKRMNEIRTLLPDGAKKHAENIILRALIYCRQRITDTIEPESFVMAVLQAAEFGLAIDGRLAHALPFGKEEKDKGKKELARQGERPKKLVFVPDYKGMICVARWRNLITDARAYVVHEGDDFEPPLEDESGTHFRYREAIGKRGRRIGAFCVLDTPGGKRLPFFMAESELKRVRACAKTEIVWSRWEVPMYCKAVIRRSLKFYQDDPRIQDLIAADNRGFDLDAIDHQEAVEVIDVSDDDVRLAERPQPIDVRSNDTAKPVASPPPAPATPVPAPPVPPDAESRERLWAEWSTVRRKLTAEEITVIRKEFQIETIDTSIATDALRGCLSMAYELMQGRRE